ncbi:DNA helicase (PIF1) [Ceratobasidium theobromae]|uniref:ATP-dependent DNA helicase n=1 Tax=Ceratobasidium theobromae TaxID=1582974 RepID=A0A5N5QA38_9AGAM|nr:DNA helicase (PIF1) [Ceratobasidium theobromae]
MASCRPNSGLLSLLTPRSRAYYNSGYQIFGSIKFLIGRSYLHQTRLCLQPGSSSNQLATTDGSPKLSEEQNRALTIVLQGANLFITGRAGTGKSFLLKKIIEELKTREIPVAVTAASSLAALDIGGTPLFHFTEAQTEAQIKKLIARWREIPDYRTKWCEPKVLIIDEISMVEGPYFDALDSLLRKTRKDKTRFGGIQIIAAGDFFQLPPEPITSATPLFAFESERWESTFLDKIELTQTFRQSQPTMIHLLEDVRTGKISEISEKLLKSLERPVKIGDKIDPVELQPLQVRANDINQMQLRNTKTESILYSARDRIVAADGTIVSKRMIKEESELLDGMIPETAELKVGMQVMCVRDMLPGLVENGSLGRVVDFLGIKEITKNPPPARLLITDDQLTAKGIPAKIYEILACQPHEWPVVHFENGIKALIHPVQFSMPHDVIKRTTLLRLQLPLVPAKAASVCSSPVEQYQVQD